jgi:mannose-6-phosphate isomerase-like protein (cupin superfamily)
LSRKDLRHALHDNHPGKPGTLIVIPKCTAHGGTPVSSGPVKAIAIKIPPQPKDDVVFVNRAARLQ